MQAGPLLPTRDDILAVDVAGRRAHEDRPAGNRPRRRAGRPAPPPPIAARSAPPAAAKLPPPSRSPSVPGSGGSIGSSTTFSGIVALRPITLLSRASASNSRSRDRIKFSRLSDNCTSARSTSSRSASPFCSRVLRNRAKWLRRGGLRLPPRAATRWPRARRGTSPPRRTLPFAEPARAGTRRSARASTACMCRPLVRPKS